MTVDTVCIISDYKNLSACAAHFPCNRFGCQYLSDSDFYSGADAYVRSQSDLCVSGADGIGTLDAEFHCGIYGAVVV